ncbi:hypothetical protein FOA52_011029 [Chlamydomonas sp. UWO 241]|nr:hypothetical protein FOA52_011029 [Chlamydomonas sp. UWO 241]
MPVRVMRGLKVDGRLQYAYDGLYRVKEHKMVPSKQPREDGGTPFTVIQFLMEAIPGHSVVSHTVTFASMFKRGGAREYIPRRLAAADSDDEEGYDGIKKRKRVAPNFYMPGSAKQRASEDRVTAARARLEEIRKLDGVLVEDLSCGLERYPIPVINTVNDRRPPPLTYIKDMRYAPYVGELVAPLLAEENARFLHYTNGTRCGLAFNRHKLRLDAPLPDDHPFKHIGEFNYNSQGLLMRTAPLGVHECSGACTAKVSNGISLPLEVYMTETIGWGVRCADPIKSGTFVCAYAGEVITEAMASKRHGGDEYIFDMDHFVELFHIQKQQAKERGTDPTHQGIFDLAQAIPTPRCMAELLTQRIKQFPAEVVEPASSAATANGGAAAASPPADDGSSLSRADPSHARATRDHLSLKRGAPPSEGDRPSGGESRIGEAEAGGAPCGASNGGAPASADAPAPAASADDDGDAPSAAGGTAPAPSAAVDPAAAAAAAAAAADTAALKEALTLPEPILPGSGDMEGNLLSIDAGCTANVARFINHSCDPNLILQQVFARDSRNMLYYYVAVFAQKNIPANVQLSYDYGDNMTHAAGLNCILLVLRQEPTGWHAQVVYVDPSALSPVYTRDANVHKQPPSEHITTMPESNGVGPSNGAGPSTAPRPQSGIDWNDLDLDPSAVEKKDAALAKYRAEVARVSKSAKPAKPDMQAYKSLNEELTPKNVYGHVPGIAVGETFNGRGDAAIFGLHGRIQAGIDGSNKTAKGTYTICLAGGYADDKDEGAVFWPAARLACLCVMHGFKADGRLQYAYDRLYRVKEYKMEPSTQPRTDGGFPCLIIQFLMKAIPGHSVVSHTVTFASMFRRNGAPESIPRQLASAGDDDDEGYDGVEKRKRAAPSSYAPSSAAALAQRAMQMAAEDRETAACARLEEIRKLDGVLVEDLSCGLERYPIPVINTVNDQSPPPLTYIKDMRYAPYVGELVTQLMAEEDARFLQYTDGSRCGLAFNRHLVRLDAPLLDDHPFKHTDELNYEPEGLLMRTTPLGVHKCSSTCTAKGCKHNMQVSNGISLPLEVFMTDTIGWGVRYADPVKAGRFICAYVGEVITEVMANKRHGGDQYLYGLDHFVELYYIQKQQTEEEGTYPAHQVPPEPRCMDELLTARIKQFPAEVEDKRAKAAADAAAAGAATTATALADSLGGVATSGAAAKDGYEDGHKAEHPSTATTVPDCPATTNGAAAAASPPAGNGAPLVRADPDHACATQNHRPLEGRGTPPAEGEGPAGGESRSSEAEAGGAPTGTSNGGGRALADAPALVASAMCAGTAASAAADAATSAPAGTAVDPAAAAAAAVAAAAADAAALNEALTMPAPILPGSDDVGGDLLSIDAERVGNIARFLNHSCEPNLSMQPVFARGCRNMLYYYVAFFAGQDIPANVELTYDYNVKMTNTSGLNCMCGAPSCSGRGAPSASQHKGDGL